MDDSDGSDMVIEVLCSLTMFTDVCRLFTIIRYDVDRGCQVDTVSVTGVKTAAMLWTEYPE